MEFAKVYQNEANGQKTITLPQTADVRPGFTALITSAGNSYEVLPDEMQPQVLLKIAVPTAADLQRELAAGLLIGVASVFFVTRYLSRDGDAT